MKNTDSAHWRIAWALVLCVTCMSCTPDASRPKDPQSKLAAILEGNAEVFDAFPDHPESEALLETLLDTVRGESPEQGEDPRRTLMGLMADNTVGLYLFEQLYAEILESSPEAARS
ncbi:MAG: hypothetical protein JXA57_16370, partial [Armatimonadetes bacterium]|nr:hypothetical protein [Armatimonadota bacterium]